MAGPRTTVAPRRRAFTLIELLVVVAIIALLISILLPSLSAAREQGKVAKCLANLKSINLATQQYFLEYNDSFPMLLNSSDDTSGSCGGICSWSWGGKTSHDYWEGSPFYLRIGDKPINEYLFSDGVPHDMKETGGTIRRAEVLVAKCPSDLQSSQRKYDDLANQDSISCYEDIGTSYHFNLFVLLGTRYPMWYENDCAGATELVQTLVRDGQAGFSGRFAFYLEDKMDWALNVRQQLMGDHMRFSKYVIGFLDGHADYVYADTRGWCGKGWMVINPMWVNDDTLNPNRTTEYRRPQKNCDPPE